MGSAARRKAWKERSRSFLGNDAEAPFALGLILIVAVKSRRSAFPLARRRERGDVRHDLWVKIRINAGDQ